MAKPQTLKLVIMSPEETMFEGYIASLSCHNPKGSFDILPEHTNFMSMIDSAINIRLADGTHKEMNVHDAVLQVQDNQITVLVNFQEKQQQSLFDQLFRPS